MRGQPEPAGIRWICAKMMSDETAAPADDTATAEEVIAAAEPAVDPAEVLRTENAELRDRLLRTVAEMENLRKRTEREKAEATLYAASNFARDLLSVSDNLGRALQAISQDERDQAGEIEKNLIAGVEVTERELHNIFQRHGIRKRCRWQRGERERQRHPRRHATDIDR